MEMTKEEFIAQRAKFFTDRGYPAPRQDLAENAWRGHLYMLGKGKFWRVAPSTPEWEPDEEAATGGEGH